MAHDFAQMVTANKVPSSLLLIGATRDEAIALAKQLLGEKHHPKIAVNSHPDLHFYAPEEKSGLHSMATIQKLVAEMSLPPFEAKCKVFIVEESEKMLPSASNALLKTLEEPNEDTYFLLASNYPERLLPTILSRLRPLSFTSEKTKGLDVENYVALAQNQRWDQLLDMIGEEEPHLFLQGCLEWAVKSKNPLLFQKMSTAVSTAETALQHRLKPRTVFLDLILKIEQLLSA